MVPHDFARPRRMYLGLTLAPLSLRLLGGFLAGIALVLFLVLVACQFKPTTGAVAEATTSLTILYTGDVVGNLEPCG